MLSGGGLLTVRHLQTGKMQLFFLLAGAIVSIGDNPVDVADEQIVYRIEAHVPAYPNVYYFLETRKLVAGNQGHLHDYAQSVEGDVVGISFNDMSVPIEVSAGKEWKYKSHSCRARSWAGTETARFLIICNEAAPTTEERIVYVYQAGKGITGFFQPCLLDKDCWFQLQSKRGLFAILPPLAASDPSKQN